MKKSALLFVFCLLPALAFAQVTFVKKSFIEFASGRKPTPDELRATPLYVEVPESFVPGRNLPTVGDVLIGEPADIETVKRESKYTTTEKGMFRLGVSTSTHYNAEKDRFSAEDDIPDAKQLEKIGMSNFVSERIKGPVPMLLTTAEVGGRKTFVLNMALAQPAATTVKLFFYQSKNPNNLDVEIVRRFVKSLAEE
ncbi:MAG TPA: hypothetical protein VNW52_06485 [Burkholderiaceae bacterium]|jgi:hypothetical protein|nr:hypothetical protein [Burkholderiaceae bacterium]